MNFYFDFDFIAKHEKKISVTEFVTMIVITIFLGSMFIFSLSLSDKTSSLVLFIMLVLSLASVHFFLVFLADFKQFGKDIDEACAQAEKKWGEAKEKFEKEKDAEFRIKFRKIKLDVVKFCICFLPVGLLGWKVDWLPIFYNVKEWLQTMGSIFSGIIS